MAPKNPKFLEFVDRHGPTCFSFIIAPENGSKVSTTKPRVVSGDPEDGKAITLKASSPHRWIDLSEWLHLDCTAVRSAVYSWFPLTILSTWSS